ncbi:TraR/DksA C4-type zinc finger protein [Patescibacteria group bacterium]|nr:TraR/DksA C4-type zinc finger protein [Patescibacteria group bacterium]MBU1246905.1 TraR/DksA C4-type zinc finger protein [Patescibacteria group bacterium]MBU1519416.1 TraR/DksA C4-type zinc finger protein [Patescibacteria group bacterium]MBU1730253.1 TraR/DksA C4-type zinc finger protein [Patescibacteria group bacterium]MBU1956088.1 TraR/DksA C4-type zinc finger protein [Patescibacteria group bacterium]
MTIDIQYFQERLEKEKAELVNSLEDVGFINPDNPKDWVGKPDPTETEHSDKNTNADNIEEYEINIAVVSTLELRLQNINAALERIKNNTYGICSVCKQPIEEGRLEANIAADTCKEHMGK